jgi:hypothetical protein
VSEIGFVLSDFGMLPRIFNNLLALFSKKIVCSACPDLVSRILNLKSRIWFFPLGIGGARPFRPSCWRFLSDLVIAKYPGCRIRSSTGFFGMARHKQKCNSLIRKDIPAWVVDFCRPGRAIADTPDVV